MSIAFRYAAVSDVGLVRANNQDSAYAGPHLLAVADGMGGHAGGDTASSLAIANLAPLDDEAVGSGDILTRLEETIESARLDLVDHARANPKLAGMGTTITAILRSGNKLAMAHMGDSRAYLLHDDEFTQVTVDHTFVQHLVDTGRITPEEAESHPQRSVVMRVLGDFEVELSPDVSLREARPGDRWLLCSDGLSGYVARSTIERTLRDIEDPHECVEKLLQLALRAGGPDNVTCIVADVVDLDELPESDVPDQSVTVVGAAAASRDNRTAAKDGPAARAASLAAEVRAGVTKDEATDETTDEAIELQLDAAPRRRRWLTVLIALLSLGLLAGGGWFGYQWTQQQYYLSVVDGQVVIYRGIPQTLGPLSLSHPVEYTGTNLTDLPAFAQPPLSNSSITANSYEDIVAKWDEIHSNTDQVADPAEPGDDPQQPTTPAEPDATTDQTTSPPAENG
ncbi:protein phosphatase [Micrococcales bacterium KH10]|nr:protein phosphatase [Micrococcales bacterium KH10]